MVTTGAAAHPPARSTLPLAESRVDSFRVTMPQLGGRQRTIRVYLPKGYELATSRAYPVLYLQDGQQLFAPGPFGDWLIDETMDRLCDRAASNGVIVVGIDNSEHRWSEYGPWKSTAMHAWVDASWSRPEEGGEGDAYVAFVAETLKPAIDARYRTRADAAHTGIGGSSMGGLIALYAGLSRPDVFGRVMSMSTATWFAEEGSHWLERNRLVRYVRTHRPPAETRIYLDVGTAERSREADPDVRDAEGHAVTYPRAYVEGSLAVARALHEAGVPDDHVRHVVDEGAMHHESAWSRRFEDAVLWLFT